MSDTNDWASRVDQMTAATVHEQLRTVVRDAEAMLEKFTATAYEQGGLLLDAQRETEVLVERKIAELSSTLNESLDAMRKDIASMAELLATALTDVRAARPSPAPTAIAS